jgi:hypothetical protein
MKWELKHTKINYKKIFEFYYNNFRVKKFQSFIIRCLTHNTTNNNHQKYVKYIFFR